MYVVIGASGFLGAYVIRQILEKTEEDVLAVTHQAWEPNISDPRLHWTSCDIADPVAVETLNQEFLDRQSYNKIIFLAAYHHPDRVEQNPKLAWDINVTALSRFLNTAERVTRFCYPSTDSVYGESRDGYRFRESDPLHPVNRYGKQKAVAEMLVTSYGYHVVRFPFLIGPSLTPHKQHFYDTIVQTISSGKTFDMFADSYRSSLDFQTAASLLIQLMELPAEAVPPIVNLCGDEALSKYDVGLMIAEQIGVPKERILPISIHADGGIFDAKRASSTLMDNSLLKRTLHLDRVQINL